jgi:hypothetical protein
VYLPRIGHDDLAIGLDHDTCTDRDRGQEFVPLIEAVRRVEQDQVIVLPSAAVRSRCASASPGTTRPWAPSCSVSRFSRSAASASRPVSTNGGVQRAAGQRLDPECAGAGEGIEDSGALDGVE